MHIIEGFVEDDEDYDQLISQDLKEYLDYLITGKFNDDRHKAVVLGEDGNNQLHLEYKVEKGVFDYTYMVNIDEIDGDIFEYIESLLKSEVVKYLDIVNKPVRSKFNRNNFNAPF